MKVIQIKNNDNNSYNNDTCSNCIKGVKINSSKTIEETSKSNEEKKK